MLDFMINLGHTDKGRLQKPKSRKLSVKEQDFPKKGGKAEGEGGI